MHVWFDFNSFWGERRTAQREGKHRNMDAAVVL